MKQPTCIPYNFGVIDYNPSSNTGRRNFTFTSGLPGVRGSRPNTWTNTFKLKKSFPKISFKIVSHYNKSSGPLTV